MGTASFLLTAISTLAGVVGAYFAWAAVASKFRRPQRSRIPPPPPLRGSPLGTTSYDTFVSYAPEDTDWVKHFVQQLQAQGLRVATDQVSMPGSEIVHSQAQSILDSAHGIVIFGESAKERRWVDAQYQTLVRRAIETKQKFIPVLIADVTLWEFANNYVPADFRGLDQDSEAYSQLIGQVAQSLRSEE